MARYSRSRTPPKRRRQRSYTSSSSSRSRSMSRSPERGRPKYQSQNKKGTRGRSRSRSRSRSPARKDRGGRGYRSAKQQKRRSRSFSPRSRSYGGTSKARSRSPSMSRRNDRYKSPGRDGRDKNEAMSYKQEEQPYLPPKNQMDARGGYQGGAVGQTHQDNRLRQPDDSRIPPSDNMYRDDYDKRGQLPGQFCGPQTPPREKSYSKESYREKEKTKYEAVSPDDLHFTKSPHRSGSPYSRKTTKSKEDPSAKPFYTNQESYGPAEPQKVKMNPPPIIRPIFDPYSVKIPRRKDEGLKEIFDRPELKGRCVPEETEVAPETRFVAVAEKKEPVVYRQDVHFTGTLPSGTLPPQTQAREFADRRESAVLNFEPQRMSYLTPNQQYPPRRNADVVGSSQYPSQPLTYQVQPNEQFQSVKDVQHLADYRQAAFVHGPSPPIPLPQLNNFDDSISYQYPPDDLPDFKGHHDLRHDLETRRKQMEQQHGSMRSLSKSRSRSRSRSGRRSNSRSLSPLPPYKGSSYQRSRSKSYDRSDSMRSRDRRPVLERLGDLPKSTRNNSFSDDGGKKADWRSKQKNYFFHDRDGRSNSRERDSRDSRDTGKKVTKFPNSTRGGVRGRGRGYLGKNFIPGFKRGVTRAVGRYQRGGSGRGFGKSDNSSRTWTHDLFDKERDIEDGSNRGEENKKDKKKAKRDGKEKDKKLLKPKGKKNKKTKKSPSEADVKDKTKDDSQSQGLMT